MSKVIRALLAASLVALILPAGVTAHWPIVDRYSWVSQWYWSGHRAIDIAAPYGTRIVPIRTGQVVFAGWRSGGGGYQVYVSHGNGLYTVYCHMSRVHAWRGEWVRDESTVIGYVGASGDATGPHTHTEVWHGYPWHYGSYRVNPWYYIDSGCSSRTGTARSRSRAAGSRAGADTLDRCPPSGSPRASPSSTGRS